MFWIRLRQTIFALITVVGFVWTNYYLVQFIEITQGAFTLTNLLCFDVQAFTEQVFANPASSFIGADATIAAVSGITLIVAEGQRLRIRLWGSTLQGSSYYPLPLGFFYFYSCTSRS